MKYFPEISPNGMDCCKAIEKPLILHLLIYVSSRLNHGNVRNNLLLIVLNLQSWWMLSYGETNGAVVIHEMRRSAWCVSFSIWRRFCLLYLPINFSRQSKKKRKKEKKKRARHSFVTRILHIGWATAIHGTAPLGLILVVKYIHNELVGKVLNTT